MKCHPQLQEFLREHHGAVRVGRDPPKVVESGEAREVTKLAQRIVRLFAAELDPYFGLEEQGILVALAQAGEHELVQRTLGEHIDRWSCDASPTCSWRISPSRNASYSRWHKNKWQRVDCAASIHSSDLCNALHKAADPTRRGLL